jgi:cholesterol transport system auxiliary component
VILNPSRAARRLALLASLAPALLVAACATPSPATFDLTAPTMAKPVGVARGQLVVTEPTALEIINSDRIIIRPRDGEVSYLGGAQWADRLPSLIQTRLIQTFENAKRTGTVGRPSDKIVADASLAIEVRTFEIDASQGATAVVSLSVRLVGESSGRIIGAEIFTARVPAAGTSGPQAASALDTALQEVLREVVIWASRRA